MTAAHLAVARPPRHLLVVAAQCDKPDELPGLEDAGRRLHAALVAPELGDCVDRGEGHSLLVGHAPGRTRVEDAITEAVELAKRDGGPLVLALLGHGLGGCGGPLYFVTSGSQNDPVSKQLDVSSVIGAAANDASLGGLIAVVDTCYAGAALPAPQAVTSGVRQGNVSFSLLFAASAQMPAWYLGLSETLASLMEEGVPDAGDHLLIDEQLTKVLRSRIVTQTPGHVNFDGAPLPGGPLWLSRNAQAARRRAVGSLGPLAQERLRKVLRPFEGTAGIGTEADLKAWLAQADAASQPWGHALQRVREFHDDLRTCSDALRALDDAFGATLTENLLRRAAARTRLPLELVTRTPCPSLRDVVEHAVVLAPGTRTSERLRPLAHLAAALTHVTGLPTLPERLTTWAQNIGITTAVNSRLHELARATPRLVLVVADDGGEQIVRVEASLLFGEAVVHIARFPCTSGGEAAALEAAVGWALSWLTAAGEKLVPVDLSVPTLLLLDPPLEERKLGRRRRMLGIDYDVTTRWSGLLAPPPGVTLDEMLQTGKQLLSALYGEGRGGSGPEWLGSEELTSVEALQELLDRRQAGASVWGVSAWPESDDVFGLMVEELLIHSPALLWPRRKDIADVHALRDAVTRHWPSLPEKLIHACKSRLGVCRDGEEAPGPLAEIRAAWHDEHWQAFCLRRAGRAVTAPPEVTPKERAS
ncbi:hypothetical protein OG416_35635 (plasmid) [Streptomyces longwoodensis]|uniref:vWA-MoxR associated conflict system protein n=1 Tax=Streptomyces longwoodensis TaxID=68231 RepID=UPI002F914217|nr:hypothetical protein OG416_35635 [Streptomyces longwoodensis]